MFLPGKFVIISIFCHFFFHCPTVSVSSFIMYQEGSLEPLLPHWPVPPSSKPPPTSDTPPLVTFLCHWIPPVPAVLPHRCGGGCHVWPSWCPGVPGDVHPEPWLPWKWTHAVQLGWGEYQTGRPGKQSTQRVWRSGSWKWWQRSGQQGTTSNYN